MPAVPDRSFEESQSVTPSLPFESPDLQSGNLSNIPGEGVTPLSSLACFLKFLILLAFPHDKQ